MSMEEVDGKEAAHPLSRYQLLGEGSDDGGEHDADGRGLHRPRLSSLVDGGIGKASVFSSICNLSNAILGAGMLGLPFAFSDSGWVLSLLLLCLSGVASCFTLHLLSICSREVGNGDATFYMLAKTAMSSGIWIVELAVILNCFGLSCSYLVVFGELMPYVFGTPHASSTSTSAPAVATNSYLWVSIGLVFVTPLAFAPTLDMLRFTSAAGMAAVVFLTAVVIAYFFGGGACGDGDDDDTHGMHCGGEVVEFRMNTAILQTLSIITFAFTAHAQLLSVANEVKDYTQTKMDFICACAIGLCGVLYSSVGYMGYMTFGDNVDDNLLESYPSDVVVTIARVGISALVGVSYPLMCKPARDSIFSLLANSSSERIKDLTKSTSAYVIITSVYLALSYVVAMSTVNMKSALGIILSLLGATCSTTIAYIIPTLVYVTLHPEPHAKKNLAIFVGCVGTIMMPLCIIATFL